MANEIIDMHNRITTEELERLLRHQLEQIFAHPELAAELPPLMIWGAPGIGKSTIIRTVAPRRAYLTHISHHLGLYKELTPTLPDNVSLGIDNEVIEVASL